MRTVSRGASDGNGSQSLTTAKAHIGVDKETGLVHHVEVTVANVHGVTVMRALLTGGEMETYGGGGYLGADKREGAITRN